ncbi:hypothetical protein [Sorangium sp. So ce1389]|uniref:hypothetical protein n=1 Tax=Sorangium sp. So ce1389 TaxID=3133336 RepID=UPI003F63A147
MKSKVHHVVSLALAVVLVAVISACVQGRFTVRAARLTVTERSDRVRGDEPYLGMIRFQSRFGTRGSTDVVVLDELRTLGDQVRPGSSLPIPAEVGEVRFGATAALSRQEIVADGLQPGLGGVIYVAMEEDHGGKPEVRAVLREAAEQLRTTLVQHVEEESWSDIAFALALYQVRTGLESGAGEVAGEGRCGLLDTRVCRFLKSRVGDDFIGHAAIIHVGIEDDYFRELLPSWTETAGLFGEQWPGCDDGSNPVCPVGTRAHALLLDGAGDGSYRLDLEATFEDSSGR